MDLVELAPIGGQPASDFLAAKLVYKCLGYLQEAEAGTARGPRRTASPAAASAMRARPGGPRPALGFSGPGAYRPPGARSDTQRSWSTAFSSHGRRSK
jgi:hypothetical protein